MYSGAAGRTGVESMGACIAGGRSCWHVMSRCDARVQPVGSAPQAPRPIPLPGRHRRTGTTHPRGCVAAGHDRDDHQWLRLWYVITSFRKCWLVKVLKKGLTWLKYISDRLFKSWMAWPNPWHLRFTPNHTSFSFLSPSSARDKCFCFPNGTVLQKYISLQFFMLLGSCSVSCTYS